MWIGKPFLVSPARDINLVLLSNTIAYFAFRFTQIALPLVVLREFGSAALAGLVGGLAGIPVVASPWWARQLRQRLANGWGLALVSTWQAFAILLLPLALAFGFFTPVLLGVVGLAVGVADALSGPGRIALLGDLSDHAERRRLLAAPAGGTAAVTGEAATKIVTWDDALRRASMVLGPALAGVGVTLGWTTAMLWVEGAALLVSALLIHRVMVPASESVETREQSAAPSILQSVGSQPDILRGWVMRGTSCLSWFAFTLGLATLGERTGQLGLQATALTAYGIGCFVVTILIASRPSARSPLRTAGLSWAGTGLAFSAMALSAHPVPIAITSAVCGAITVFGIRALTQVLLQQTHGSERRAALAGQSIVVDVTVAVGMLVGGLLIDRFGPQPVLFVSGLLTAAVAWIAVYLPGRLPRRVLSRWMAQPAAVVSRG